MRMLPLAIALLLMACGKDSVGSDATPKAQTAFSADAAMGYVKTQLDFGPRAPGTPAHEREGDWIVAEMRKRADTVIVQEWTHTTIDRKALRMRNVFARINAKATDRVLYVTHWDTRPMADSDPDPLNRTKPIPGANDGASGVALFLALADALKKTPPNVGVDLLFVDGEDYGEFCEESGVSEKCPDVLIGSRWFAEHLPSADYKPLYGVLWDMIADRNLQIYQELNSAQQAPEVVTRVWQQAADLGYQRWFIPSAKIPITDDHIPLLAKGLRVIDVIDIDYCTTNTTDCGAVGTTWHHTLGDTMDKISAASLQIVGDVALALVTR